MKTTKAILFFAMALVAIACNDNDAPCPEAQTVKETQEEILILEYQITQLLYQIRDLDPISDADQITILRHQVFSLELDIDFKQDFIDEIRANSDCI